MVIGSTSVVLMAATNMMPGVFVTSSICTARASLGAHPYADPTPSGLYIISSTATTDSASIAILRIRNYASPRQGCTRSEMVMVRLERAFLRAVRGDVLVW